MATIRIRRKTGAASTLKGGELGIADNQIYFGQHSLGDTAGAATRIANFDDITKANVGLSNVTNDAQVKKLASSTNGYVPTWNGTTGDALAAGYGVKTAVEGTWNTTDLVRADVVKSYADSVAAAADAMVFKGTVGTGGTYTIVNFNALATYSIGWTYKVISAGTIKGKVCEIGDMVIATVERAGSGQLDDDWTVVQTNIDGAVTGPATSVSGYVPLWNNTVGTLLQAGKAISDSSSAAAIGTGTNLVTERDIYYGLPAINNAHNYTSSTNIYAPTGGGLVGQALRAVGATSTPIWEAVSDATESGAVANSSGLTTSRQVYHGLVQVNGINQTRGTTIWVPGAAGTLNQILRSGGAGTAPSWNTFSHSLLSDHTIAGQNTGHFLKATSATTFAFQAHGLTHTSVGAAAASHSHGSITSAGAIGSTPGMVVVTGTSGVLEALSTLDEGVWT